jgi:putative ABC transport system permease protein
VSTTAANHPAVGPAMKADFPEVKNFVRVVNATLVMNTATLSYREEKGEEKIFNEKSVYVADDSFFDIFSYPLISGDRHTCLSEANSVVITENIAEKYFRKSDPMDKMIYSFLL